MPFYCADSDRQKDMTASGMNVKGTALRPLNFNNMILLKFYLYK